MALDYQTIQSGDVVQYSDMANPPRTWIVYRIQIAVTMGSSHREFYLASVDAPYDYTISDLRQQGWDLVTEGPRG